MEQCERDLGVEEGETASEILRDERSEKWEDRRRSEREVDEILELLGKHERRRKRNGETGGREMDEMGHERRFGTGQALTNPNRIT